MRVPRHLLLAGATAALLGAVLVVPLLPESPVAGVLVPSPSALKTRQWPAAELPPRASTIGGPQPQGAREPQETPAPTALAAATSLAAPSDALFDETSSTPDSRFAARGVGASRSSSSRIRTRAG